MLNIYCTINSITVNNFFNKLLDDFYNQNKSNIDKEKTKIKDKDIAFNLINNKNSTVVQNSYRITKTKYDFFKNLAICFNLTLNSLITKLVIDFFKTNIKNIEKILIIKIKDLNEFIKNY